MPGTGICLSALTDNPYITPMRYGPHLLEEVLRRTDLVQLVGRRVKLTRKGRVLWGCCPFHQEKSPSFKVENERRTYKCFGCGAGGDAFKWLMETEGLNFPEAVERLAGEAGVELPKWSPEDEAREAKKKTLYDVTEAAAAYFEEQLQEPSGRQAREYLANRGLSEDVQKKFRLGYAPNASTALIGYLTTKNIPFDDIVAAGLARPADETRGARDFFYNRVMFPIADLRGRIVAFGARALDPDAKPKYINTGETTLFSKGHLLYNFHAARPAAISAQTIILAEGYMDVIALARAGFTHAVAPLGTAFTEDQLALLWRVAPEPILAFDGDEAGVRAGTRAAHMALAHLKPGYSLRFAFLPPGEDPDTLIAREGAGAMRALLEAALPLSDVLWRSETEGKEITTPERRAGLERTLAEIVSQINDGKIADYYRREFDERVFAAFKRRRSIGFGAGGRGRDAGRNYGKFGGGQRGSRSAGAYSGGVARPGFGKPVSQALKNSALARGGTAGVRAIKENELGALLFAAPGLAHSHTETLAALPFLDRQLDKMRHELLNLAASGAHLETGRLENHLVRSGLGELAARFSLRRGASGLDGNRDPKGSEPKPADRGTADGEDIEARFLRAASQLRDIVESGPERIRAMERFKSEPTEESWDDAYRLLGPKPQSTE